MEYAIFRFTLNVRNHRSQAAIKAFKGDTAIKLIISLTDGGNRYNINNGCVATLTGTRADGVKIKHDCTIVDNTIIYLFDEETTDCTGLVNCEITLYDGNGGVLTAPKFTIDVDEKEVDGEEAISEYSSAAIATVMGAAAKEYAREQQELARQTNEVQRQESYDNALNTANDAKEIAEEAKTAASGAKDSAESAATTAVEAKNAAVSAATTAVEARDSAVSASETAVNAADMAEGNAIGAGMSAGDAENAAMTVSEMLRSFHFDYDHENGIFKVSFKALSGRSYNESSLTDGEVTIDLPLESSIINIEEDNDGVGNTVLKLTLANGTERTVPLPDLISGFVTKKEFEDVQKNMLPKQNNTKSYARAYVDFGSDPEGPGDGYLLCSSGSTTKGVQANQHGALVRFTNYGTLNSNDPTAAYEVVNKRTLDREISKTANQSYVDSKINAASDTLSGIIARLSSKVFGAEVKDVNLADYLNDPEYASTVETFVQNSVGLYSLKLEAEYEMEDAWGNTLAVANILPDIKVIPRKTLIWDTPVECEIVSDTLRIDYYGNTAEEWIDNPRVVSCAMELSSDNNTCINVYARIRYTYVWYNIEEGYEDRQDDVEMSVMFQVPWDAWNGGYTDQRIITSVLVNEFTRPLLPTTYSLRGDVTEMEINMANEMDGLIEKMKSVRERKSSQQEET